jgi:hypothetical protein
MTAQLAAPALMNVPLTRFLKVISIKLIRMFALTVVHAPMYARLKQFILHKQQCLKFDLKAPHQRGFFYPRSQETLLFEDCLLVQVLNDLPFTLYLQ